MSDVKLPQNDQENASQREASLAAGQKKYQYKYNYHALYDVPMAKGLPWPEEKPTLKWTLKVVATLVRLLVNYVLYLLSSLAIYKLIKFFFAQRFNFLLSGKDDRPQKLNKYRSYFRSLKVPMIADNYQEDGLFGRMRVAGQNPVVIQQISALDADFPVTEAIFQSVKGFEHDSLEKAGAEHRLYLADYVDIRDIENGETHNIKKYICVPKALFAIPAQHDGNLKTALLPIAIQCAQTPANGDPIFTPNDGAAWDIAKTIVQVADFSHHELITHLGATHLRIEPFVVSTHRQLADSHPLKKLLLPHFEGTILINWGAQASLVADGGPFDEMFAGTMASNRKIVAQTLARSFNDEIFPRKMQQRGVGDDKLLYPYRDDAEKIWAATAEWVSDYLSVYYTSDDDITNDTELQAWVSELVSEGWVKGFGDDASGSITSVAYLKEAVTMVIFTASTQHSAVNFTQKDFSGYTPSMPAAGYMPAPRHTKKTEEDLLEILPTLSMANDQVNLTNLLSGIEYTQLGQYDADLFEGREINDALIKFKKKLEKVEADIRARNIKELRDGITPYHYMLPSRIPQSINI